MKNLIFMLLFVSSTVMALEYYPARQTYSCKFDPGIKTIPYFILTPFYQQGVEGHESHINPDLRIEVSWENTFSHSHPRYIFDGRATRLNPENDNNCGIDKITFKTGHNFYWNESFDGDFAFSLDTCQILGYENVGKTIEATLEYAGKNFTATCGTRVH